MCRRMSTAFSPTTSLRRTERKRSGPVLRQPGPSCHWMSMLCSAMRGGVFLWFAARAFAYVHPPTVLSKVRPRARPRGRLTSAPAFASGFRSHPSGRLPGRATPPVSVVRRAPDPLQPRSAARPGHAADPPRVVNGMPSPALAAACLLLGPALWEPAGGGGSS